MSQISFCGRNFVFCNPSLWHAITGDKCKCCKDQRETDTGHPLSGSRWAYKAYDGVQFIWRQTTMAQSKSNHHYATQTNINLKAYHRIFLSSIFRCPDDLRNIVQQCAIIEGAIELVANFSHWGHAVRVSDPDVHHDSWFMKTVEDKQRIAILEIFTFIWLT